MRYLLVDRIEEARAGAPMVGWKNVAMSEDYLEWHFPEQPIMPGVLVLEAFVQLAGWHEAALSGFTRWFLVDTVQSAKYYGFAVPGDRIELTLEAVEASAPDRRAWRGESKVGGERRATVEFEGPVVDLASLEERAQMERTYAVLCGKVGYRSDASASRRGRA